MPYTTLVSTTELAAHLDDPNWAIFDCRFDLADTSWGEAQYRAAHLPGAIYVHLDRDLSGEKTGRNGRHPLPEAGDFLERVKRWGITPHTQVVAYDQNNGMYASRLWWLLRYFGHEAVAVLDGGWAKWTAEGRPVRAGEEQRVPGLFAAQAREEMRLTAEEVERIRTDPAWKLVDARAPERYRGEVEPYDPVAGHIPGAVNHYNALNVNADGTFRAPEELRARFLALLGDVPPERAVMYCGSGVAAAHNVLAMEVAGLPGARVYAGSWSEWCSDPQRPVATG
ncbi:MAG: sulfurtransferase [Anaerolineales bacterium]|nr:sulfurtransferase [Anaerolineales bacterium]